MVGAVLSLTECGGTTGKSLSRLTMRTLWELFECGRARKKAPVAVAGRQGALS